MADFYVLPPRPAVGEQLARLLRPYLPGLPVTAGDCERLLDIVAAATGAGAFLVYRDDLPDGEDVTMALCDGYGAAGGDRVVQIWTEDGGKGPRSRVTGVAEVARAA